MRIINKSRNTVLAEKATLADTFYNRSKGLLGRKELPPGLAIILSPCNSVHTFFMRFPIDILFIDKDNKVIKAISHLKPFRITRVYFNSVKAIELPANTIQQTATLPNDILVIE